MSTLNNQPTMSRQEIVAKWEALVSQGVDVVSVNVVDKVYRTLVTDMTKDLREVLSFVFFSSIECQEVNSDTADSFKNRLKTGGVRNLHILDLRKPDQVSLVLQSKLRQAEFLIKEISNLCGTENNNVATAS